jgi:hypothetical protein
VSGNNYSFDDISLPQPPIFVEGQVIEYVTEKIPQYFTSQYLALLDFVSSVQNAFLINSDQVNSLDADKITNNTQFTQSVFVGAESKIKLDGLTNQITITDRQGSPVTRVILGKISDATDDYGIRVIDAAGVVKFQSGSTTVMDGGIITANTITATQIDANTITAAEIAANTITATELAANSVTATEIDVANLSAISADLGTVTAGTITGGTIRTSASNPRLVLDSSGVYAYKADGVNTAFIGNDGQFRFGTASGDRVEWNNTTLSVTGNIIATGNIEDGAVTSPVENTTTFNAEQSSGSATIVYTNNIDVTTKGGNVILIGSISGSTDDDDGQGQYTSTLRIKKGSTTLGEVSALSTGGSETIQVVAFDGSPSGSISSSATTTYNLELTTASYDGTADAKGGFGNPATLKLITLETLK